MLYITRLGRVRNHSTPPATEYLPFGLFRKSVSLEINRGRTSPLEAQWEFLRLSRPVSKLDWKARLAVCVGECRRWHGIAIGRRN
jgi:hypothetical protein